MPVEEFYFPEIWRQQSSDSKQASVGQIPLQEQAKERYETAIKLIKHNYEELLKLGVAKEQARIMLPLSQYTEVIWTASFQALMNFVELRDKPDSQWEIREYAKAIRYILYQIYPKTSEIWEEAIFQD